MIIRKKEKKQGTNGNHIKKPNHTQFLEIILDNKLNLEEHVDRVKAKTKRSKIDYDCQLYSTASSCIN